MDSNQHAIYAKTAIEGQTYLLVLSPSSVYKLTIVSINKAVDNTNVEIVSSVTVKDERYPGALNIAGDTLLLEYNENFYLTSCKLRKIELGEQGTKSSKVTNHIKNAGNHRRIRGESKVMAQNKTPRSKVIDEQLLNVEPGVVPDWSSIAQKVIECGRAAESEVSKIIFQAKMRWKWYSVDGKVNPASVKNKSNEKVEETIPATESEGQ